MNGAEANGLLRETNPVRVGVTPWASDEPAAPGKPATLMLRQRWVDIGGVRVGATEQLIDVSYGVTDPGGVGVVTIRVLASSFATVAADDE